MTKQNWFNTLNDALASEGLLDSWDCFYGSISYEQTFTYTYDNGTRYGHYVSIYRDSRGMYERPVHYNR